MNFSAWGSSVATGLREWWLQLWEGCLDKGKPGRSGSRSGCKGIRSYSITAILLPFLFVLKYITKYYCEPRYRADIFEAGVFHWQTVRLNCRFGHNQQLSHSNCVASTSPSKHTSCSRSVKPLLQIKSAEVYVLPQLQELAGCGMLGKLISCPCPLQAHFYIVILVVISTWYSAMMATASSCWEDVEIGLSCYLRQITRCNFYSQVLV